MTARALLHRVLLLNLVVILTTVLVSAPFQKVNRQFEDGGFITYFSVVQLFILSYLAYKIFKVRRRSLPPRKTQSFFYVWKSPIAIWGIISLGFSFLALDDLLMIHEYLDGVIREVGQFQETGLSDRIDDLIVGLYGLLAIGILAVYRHELKKYRIVLPYLIISFTLLFLMVGVDVLTNRNDILMMVLPANIVDNIMSWILVPEESLKLFSEAFFIVSAQTCLRIASCLNIQERNLLSRQAVVHSRQPIHH